MERDSRRGFGVEVAAAVPMRRQLSRLIGVERRLLDPTRSGEHPGLAPALAGTLPEIAPKRGGAVEGLQGGAEQVLQLPVAGFDG